MKIFKALFITSVLKNNNWPWCAQTSDLEDHEWGSSDFPSVLTEAVKEHSADVHIFLQTDEIRNWVLKKLGDFIAGALTVVYQ